MIKKRMTALLTALVMMLSLLPAEVRAADTLGTAGTDYAYENGVLTVLSTDCHPECFPDTAAVSLVRFSSKKICPGASERDLFVGAFSNYPNLVSFEDYDNYPSPTYICPGGVLINSRTHTLLRYPPKRIGTAFVIPDGVKYVNTGSFSGTSDGLTLYARSTTIADIQANKADDLNCFVPEMVPYTQPLSTFSLQNMELHPGDSAAVAATITPEDATLKSAIWTVTSGSEYVSVDPYTGVVTAKAVGTATISATTEGVTSTGAYLTDTCTITVTEISVDKMSAPTDEDGREILSYDVDTTEGTTPTELSVTINADATDKDVIWEISDSSIATLEDASGSSGSSLGTLSLRLLADAPQTQSVTVKAKDDGNGNYVSAVTVNPQKSGTVTVTASAGNASKTFTLDLSKWVTSASVTDSDTPLYLHKEGSADTTGALSLIHDGDENAAITWGSGDTSVATVGNTGVVTAVDYGDAEITATVTTGPRTATATRTVSVRDISLDKATLQLDHHASKTLSATVSPSGKAVTWSSSDETVATVDSNGKVTAEGLGTAIITATMTESGFTATCEVTVGPLSVGNVTLNKPSLTLPLGTEENPSIAQLIATLDPTNATNRTFTWWSSNESIVSVSVNSATADANGQSAIIITALAEGEADIFVTAGGEGENARKAQCHVLVPTTVKTFSLNKDKLTLGPDGSEQLEPRFGSDNPTNQGVTWQSSDTNVVTVNDDGVVSVSSDLEFAANEAETAHTATITATTQDGTGKTATCNVTVIRNKVTSVSLDKSKLELNLTDNDKKSDTLHATVKPDDATFQDVTWQTSNNSVATVTKGENGNATVSAVAPGTATITVTTADLGFTASCTVTVAATRVTDITLKTAETLNLDLENNKTGTVTVEVTPHAATDRAVTWSSSNQDVVTVSDTATTAYESTGTTSITVTAKGVGTATVTATTHDGSKVAECAVNVASVDVNSVTVSPAAQILTLGLTPEDASAELAATIDPTNATLQGVTWHSSDETVASVEAKEGNKAIVTAHKSGTVTVTAISQDGIHKGKCVVTVRWNSTGLEMSRSEATIAKGNSMQLTADIITSSDATNLTLDWSTNKSSVATVDNTGKVTAVGTGTAIITAKVNEFTSVTATCEITVVQHAQELSLDATGKELSSKSGDDNHSFVLTATITPADVTDDIVWSVSGDTGVAELSTQTDAVDAQNSKKTSAVTVTATAGGTAVITVKAGDKTAQCTVTVPTVVTGVSVNKSTLTLGIGESDTLNAILEPYNATNRGVTWSVSEEDANFISVDSSGKVTALKVNSDGSDATATVTVTTADGGKTATCTVTVVPTGVTDVSIQKDDEAIPDDKLTLTMLEGGNTVTLTAKITPEDATDKSVTWNTSNDEVANVDSSGKVTAVAPGEAVISVTTTSGSHRAVCYVTVQKTDVQGVTLSPTTQTLSVVSGGTDHFGLTATIDPANATNKVLIWSVDDPAVVELSAYETTGDSEGEASVTVTARKAGTAVITVKSKDNLEIVKTCTVTIPETKVASLVLTAPPSEMNVGSTANLTVTVTGVGNNTPTNSTLNWISSKPEFATVEKLNATTAVVKAVAPGETTITVAATDGSGVTTNCTINVYAAADEVTLNKTSTTLTMGSNASETLTATVGPAGAKQDVTWAVTAGSDVVSVENGNITAKKAGTATVTATSTANTAAKASCTVTVVQPTESVNITQESATLKINGTNEEKIAALTVTVTPSDASAAVEWSSNNESVAAVDGSGKVTAVGRGTATITATSGGKSDTCEITVEMLASNVTLDKTSVALEIGEKVTPVATVSPADTNSKAVSWSSGNTSIATVNASTGEIEAKGVGSTTVTAAINGHTAACEVTVSAVTPKEFALSPEDTTVNVGNTAELKASVTPTGAANRSITWESSDPDIVSIDTATPELDGNSVSTVTITAHKAGSVTITAKADGKTGLQTTCTVTVPDVPVNGISLDKPSLTLLFGGEASAATDNLKATLTGQNSQTPTNADINWSSSKPAVATVTGGANGTAVVTAAGYGTTTITASPADGRDVSAACEVTVYLPVAGVTLNKTATTLTLGSESTASETLTATVNPKPGANQSVTWTVTEGSGIVSVEDGKITALKPGTAVVTATSTANTAAKINCTVTVKQPATSLELDQPTLALSMTDAANKTGTLVATVKPADTTDVIVWSVSGDAVTLGTQDDDVGLESTTSTVVVTAQKGGTARITVTSGGQSASCDVTIPVPVESVTLNKTELTLEKNRSETLTVTVKPDNAANAAVDWESSNNAVATVDESGKVTVKADAADNATATITATAKDGSGKKATCTVTAIPVKATGLAFVTLPAENKIERGKTFTLTAKVSPDNAANKAVNWVSSDESVLSVGTPSLDAETGVSAVVVTAKKVGSATITAASAENAELKKAVVITVPNVGATNVSVAETMTLKLNGTDEQKTGTLTATLLPSNTTDSVAWHSSNTGVATVSDNGDGSATVTAIGGGSAIITATADSKEIAQCTVTVNVLATRLELDQNTLTLEANGETATLTPTFTPANVSSKGLTWSVTASAPEHAGDTVVTVNGGLVTAKAPGTATITATAQDGSGKYATCAVTVTAVSVKGVGLSSKQLTLRAGENVTLTATVSPSGAANKTVEWSSDNTGAVTVDANGKVTAVKAVDDHTAATATITVTTEDGSKTDTCIVTVQPTAVTSLTLSQTSLTIPYSDRNEKQPTLTATVLPDTATNNTVGWSSSNTSVATVDATGKVVAVAPGSAVITARCASNNAIAATCEVEVTAVRAAGVSIAASLDMNLGDSQTLTPDIDPDGAYDTSVTWSSSNNAVATVDTNGAVHAVAEGTAVITVMTNDQHKTATCVVRVWTKVTGVTLNTNTLALDVGASEVLTATVAPSGATNKNVAWSSSNTAVATVDAAGRVTALKSGTAKITVTTEDQRATAACDVTVSNVAVTGVTLSQTQLTLMEGGGQTLTAAVSPANATDKTVTWSSDDEDIAKVDSAGKITAVGAGTAMIVATAGDETAECEVTVYKPIAGVTLNASTAELTITAETANPTSTLTATVDPDGDTDARVTWSSSNNEVATVVNGVVTAHRTGSATITATSVADPLAQASCRVTVVRHTTGIALNGSLSFDLSTDVRSAELTATITPDTTTDSVTWEITSGSGVAQLSAASTADGVSTVTVYALKAGTATIRVTSGTVTKNCTVTVTNPATGILLDQAELKLKKGDTKTLIATILPASAQSTAISWISNNTAAVTVSDGTVTAVATGEATITASITVNGTTYSKTCKVTVEPTLVSNIALSPSTMSLNVGVTDGTLPTPTVTPVGADNQGVNWSSSNTDVAAIVDGKIQALAVGTTLITATAKDGSGVSGSCLLTVNPIAVTSIELNKDELSLAKNASEKLTATLNSDATDKVVTWRSSNETVATVDSAGNVTAKSVGTAIITATAHGNENMTETCTVTVTASVTGVSLNHTELTLWVGDADVQMVATVAPADASHQAVTWSGGSESVATVDENGVVHAVGPGTTSVTATTTDGSHTATCSIEVKRHVSSVTLDQTALPLAIGDSGATLVATIDPSNASNKAITWSSTNESVATVANGIVTPVAPGTAVILVTTEDGGKTASCTVTVTRRANGVTLSDTELSIAKGRTAALTATVNAANGDPSDATVTWSSSNSGIATVASNGVVTGVAAGTATITATANDGSEKSQSCTVTVFVPVSGVVIKEGGAETNTLALNMVSKPSARLTYEVTEGTPSSVSWISDTPGVATVNSSGLVTAVAAGSANITLTVSTGSVSESKVCSVTVSREEIDVSDIPTSLTLLPGNASKNVTFTLPGSTAMTWSPESSDVAEHTYVAGNGTRTDTFSAKKNGVATFTWTKAADAKTEAAGGSITIYSLVEPITAISFQSLDSGCSLSAKVEGSTIRVVGYVNTDSASSYALENKLQITLATDVISGLTAAIAEDSVTVKDGGTTVKTYTIDRSGVVSLPESVDVNVSAVLVASPDVTPGAVTLNAVDNLKSASTPSVESDLSSKGIDLSSPEGGQTTIKTVIEVEPVTTTVALGTAQAIALDITPSYTATVTRTDANDQTTTDTYTGTLASVAAPVTISVTVNFIPTLIVHWHDGQPTYPSFDCTPSSRAGYYDVTWTQSSFSVVELLSAEAEEKFWENRSEEPTPEPGPEPAPTPEPDPQPEPTPKPTPKPVVIVDDDPAEPVTPVKPESKPTEPTVPTAKTFADVPASHWAAEAIAYVSARGIFNGNDKGKFLPEVTMSRGMLVQILYNFDGGSKSTGTAPFTDLAGKWYADAACWAASVGVTNGVGRLFNGEADLTREQMAAMLYRYAQLKGYDVSFDTAALDGFSDAANVSEWARDAMYWAVSKGLLNGTGRGLEPNGGADRAQVATIMMRFCEIFAPVHTA